MWIWIIALMVMLGFMAGALIIFNKELDEEYDEYNEENKEDFD